MLPSVITWTVTSPAGGTCSSETRGSEKDGLASGAAAGLTQRLGNAILQPGLAHCADALLQLLVIWARV